MPNLFGTGAAVTLFAALGIASASAVYAGQNPAPEMNHSQTGTSMRHGGMMGRQGGMMGQMSQMMEGCNAMMQRRNQPLNSQFRHPSKPPQAE